MPSVRRTLEKASGGGIEGVASFLLGEIWGDVRGMIFEECVGRFVTRSAGAKKDEFFTSSIFYGVASVRWNGNRIPWANDLRVAVESHFCRAVENVVNLLGDFVVVRSRRLAWGKPRFSQTLLTNRRIAVGQKFPDGRAVSRRERHCFALVDNFEHGREAFEAQRCERNLGLVQYQTALALRYSPFPRWPFGDLPRLSAPDWLPPS